MLCELDDCTFNVVCTEHRHTIKPVVFGGNQSKKANIHTYMYVYPLTPIDVHSSAALPRCLGNVIDKPYLVFVHIRGGVFDVFCEGVSAVLGSWRTPSEGKDQLIRHAYLSYPCICSTFYALRYPCHI